MALSTAVITILTLVGVFVFILLLIWIWEVCKKTAQIMDEKGLLNNNNSYDIDV